ncbi:MAG TPA: outer membrane beta-barrel protein [Verrucomicrobiae bacterium]|nr:outer membrane beta-barrel protein [Verrucomicrobiae bacterium]
MNKSFCVTLCLLAGAPLTTAAGYDSHPHGTLSYTFGEVRLVAEDPDGRDDADGIRVGGSALFHPDFFVAGALSMLGSDGANGVDTDTAEIGLGYRHALNRQVDLLGVAGLIRVDIDFANGSNADDDDFGPSLTGGARAALTHAIEVGGYLNYAELFGDGDLTVRGEGLFHFTPNLAALAGIGLSDDNREATIGARWNFQPTR